MIPTPTAPERGFSLRGARAGLILFLLGLGAFAPPAAGQVVPPDTIPPVPDTIPPPTPDDTLGLQELPGDTINPEDTLPAVQLPSLGTTVPAGWHTGVWTWDRDEILASKALTLAELLEGIPGTAPLRGGDFGMPVTVSAFGAGGGRIRVFRNGIELLPHEGSLTDLGRVGLGGARSVRVVRALGEMRIEVESILVEGGRPYTLIEAGTGDLNSNVFRGTFSHPRALGGAVAFTMERVDTRGPRGQEPGIAQGAWIRYARNLTSRGAFLLDFSSSASDRDQVYYPQKASRSDLSLHTRWDILPGLVGDVYYASSSLSTEKPDTFAFDPQARKQYGATVSYDSERIRGLAKYRKLSGEGVPKSSAHLEATGLLGRYGGVAGELTRESWEGKSVSRHRLRAWTTPVWGLSLFAETGSGEWGLPYLPAVPPAVRDSVGEGEETVTVVDTFAAVISGPRFAEHKGSRYGAEFRWRRFELSGALLKIESDSLFTTGLSTDRDGVTQAGGSRDGFEVAARIPLYPKGFSLVGWWQKWDQADDVLTEPQDTTGSPELLSDLDMPWRYLPRESYQASLSFHNTFYPTGNLEVWFDLGVRGREPMALPFQNEEVWAEYGAGEEDPRFVPTVSPFYQSWFVRLQIRIVTVRVFFMWDNFLVRQSNQDFIDRLLPATRSMYGVRWTLWN